MRAGCGECGMWRRERDIEMEEVVCVLSAVSRTLARLTHSHTIMIVVHSSA